MLRYSKQREPGGVLEAWRKTPRANWESLGETERQQLREALVKDQGNLCAYCQRRIEPKAASMKIEHWRARRGDASDFDWSNLLGVCLGTSNQTLHCDASKGDRTLLLHPVEGHGQDPRAHLRYLSNGEIVPDSFAKQDIEETLNLNAPFFLVRGRQQTLEALRHRLDKGGWTAKAINAELKAAEIRRGKRAVENNEVVRYFARRWLKKKKQPSSTRHTSRKST